MVIARRRVNRQPGRLFQDVEAGIGVDDADVARHLGLGRRRAAKGHRLAAVDAHAGAGRAAGDVAVAVDDALNTAARKPPNFFLQESIEAPAVTLGLDDEVVLDDVGRRCGSGHKLGVAIGLVLRVVFGVFERHRDSCYKRCAR
jgi:hypothetical protein